MLRLLKRIQLLRKFSTAIRPEPERNPAILYTGVSNINNKIIYIESNSDEINRKEMMLKQNT